MMLLEETTVEQGKRLGQLRKEHGFSQTALAEALEVTRQAVSGWERGATYPSMENLMKLSQLYQVDLAVLTGQAEPPSAEPEGNDEPEEEPQPGKPVRRISRRYILWPVCLLAACAIICATLLILRAQPWAQDGQNETEVIPISELESKEIVILPEDRAELYAPW